MFANQESRFDEGLQQFAVQQLKSASRIEIIPTTFKLLPNYPNPFNPETWIPYQLAQDTPVKIAIYDQNGKIIRLIDLGMKHAGTYIDKNNSAYWDGRNDEGSKVASGLYFYTLQAGKFTATRRMILLK